jgi:alanine racemase
VDALDGFQAVSQVEIDLGALAHNAREVRRLVGPECFIVAALKSNAHGFGLIEVATSVLDGGADAVAVVNLGDAIRLRKAGVIKPIMLYAGPVLDYASAAIIDEINLTPTVLDLAGAATLSSQVTRPIDFMVKVDVGLQRLGLNPEDVVPFVRKVAALPRLRFRGIYTHMHAINGSESQAYLNWQFRRFTDVASELEKAGVRAPITLAACSSVLLITNAMNLNAIDPGRLFYGLLPSGPQLGSARFHPAFVRLRSRLVQVKSVVRPGYPEFSPFPVRPGMRMGVFPLGRSDGMEMLSTGHVLVRGKRAPILMRPSLEHTRIDLSGIADAAVGDEVIIIGRQGGEEITPADVAKRLKMDIGELAVGVRGSIERRFLRST